MDPSAQIACTGLWKLYGADPEFGTIWSQVTLEPAPPTSPPPPMPQGWGQGPPINQTPLSDLDRSPPGALSEGVQSGHLDLTQRSQGLVKPASGSANGGSSALDQLKARADAGQLTEAELQTVYRTDPATFRALKAYLEGLR